MPRRIQHIHIPKCAGNSVFRAMRDALKPDRTLVMDSIATYLAARRLKRCRDEFEFESLHLEVKQVLLSFYFEQGWPMISGHFPFSPLCHSQFHENTDFVTILREPVERLKSHVAYLIFAQPRTCVEDYYSGKVDPAEEVYRILEKEQIGIWMARNQTIYLGGLGADGKADLENRVANSIAALDKLRLVGFDHDLAPFAARFEACYGVPLSIGRENTIREVHKDADMLKRVYEVFDGPIRPRLMEMCADDLTLYEAARSRFS
ncbi:MAG TPA: hypothetical protein VK995_04235 [Oceanipulchritudo sp.]|nr:hypothetical protein [Oceanipulchritudo sp.]